MFWKKKFREADKLITNTVEECTAQNEPSVINVKIAAQDQLFSAYDYSGDRLNAEFGDYVFEQAKRVPITSDITVNIHTSEDIDTQEAERALKNHFGAVYRDAKKEVSRKTAISLIMTVLGIIALTALILINHFTDNLYITSIVEIAAWVFIWEAVDNYFLQRPVVKGKCVLIQRIYAAKIEINKI